MKGARSDDGIAEETHNTLEQLVQEAEDTDKWRKIINHDP